MTTPFITDGSDRSAQDLRFWYYGGVSAGEKEYLRQCYIAGINAYAVLQHIQAGGTGSGGLPVGGSTNQALTKKSPTDYDVQWSTISGGATVARVSGDWFFPLGANTPGPIAASVNYMYAHPWVADFNGSIKALQIDITAAATAGGIARLGIYSDSGGLPNILMGSGQVVTTAAAPVAATLDTPVQVTAGQMCWFAAVPQVQSATFRSYGTIVMPPFRLSNGAPPATQPNALFGFQLSNVSGAMPALFNVAGSTMANNTFRLAAQVA